MPPWRRKLEHVRFRPPVDAAGVIIACEIVPSAGERRVTLAKPRFRACEPCVRRKLLTLGEKTSCKNLRTSPVRCLERRKRRLCGKGGGGEREKHRVVHGDSHVRTLGLW